MLTPQQPDAYLERINYQGGIVAISGEVRPGDRIQIELPPEPHQSLDRV
jgi:MOSC domain-containing protein YiiM